tara:strand:- start:5512 stop:6324 length:813 start_codon:yes stop_codon:yes gene_type:complete
MAADDVQEELIYRTSNGKVEDVRLLAAKIPDLSTIRDGAGWPLLSIAASRADGLALPVVKVLHDAGANLNDGGPQKNYPIFIAVQSGNQDVVQYLLEQGADYRVRDVYGMTIIDFAEQSATPDIAEMVAAAVARDRAAYRDARSPQAFNHHFKGLAEATCAHQYYAFYYATKQDPIPEAEQKETLAQYEADAAKHLGHLQHYFQLANFISQKLIEQTRAEMRVELDNLVSNRWRRKKGVGSQEDMQTRCNAIVAKYEGWSREDAEQLNAR